MPRPSLPVDWRSRVVAGMRARAIGKCEGPSNRGFLPEYVQRRNGGELGEFYCMDTVGATFLDVVGHASPLLLSGSCEQQRQRAIAKGTRRTRAEFESARGVDPMLAAAWIFLVIGPDDAGKPHAHHTGTVGDINERTGAIVVTGPRGGFLTCEGNAADPTKPASRNGDGIYHGRERGHVDDHTEYEFIAPEAFPL